MSVAIRITGRSKPPPLAWEAIKNKILGARYELSVVFPTSKRMKELNTRYREKPKTTNVLAFPLTKETGEIFVDLSVARREAPQWEMSYRDYVVFLYIHALLHLSGLDHETERASARMDREEQKWLKALR